MVEPRIVIPAVVGSSPISHPIKSSRLVSIMVITRDCLSCYGSSILPRVAKLSQVANGVLLVIGSLVLQLIRIR